MANPFFFGYGSLVNTATHSYPSAAPATAKNWRRAWVQTADRPYAYLTAVRSPGDKIQGLIAEVPNADWQALDAREEAYERLVETKNVEHDLDGISEIAIYSVPARNLKTGPAARPILLSYLDVVLQGYWDVFGTEGAEQFIATTDGWQTPVLDDRHAPIYPRAQILSAEQTRLVDDTLAGLGTPIRHHS